MGRAKGREGAAGATPSVTHGEPTVGPGSGAVSASGVRDPNESQRETTPAPPQSRDGWAADLPSARPTSVPEFDLAALALETALRHHPLPSLPLDMAVPARTHAPPPAALELRAAFLLLHVDGRSSVRDIAELTTLPVDEAVAAFLALAQMGLVEIAGVRTPGRAAPRSGERARAVAPSDATPGALDADSLGPDDDTLR
jgi:hypothetical protein